jgi:hypothetical protein
VSNNDNLLFWPLEQPLAGFLGSFLDRLVIESPFGKLLVGPVWLNERKVDWFASKLVSQLQRLRSGVARKVGSLLQLGKGDDLKPFRLDVILEAEQGGVDRPSYGRRDNEVDNLVVREVLLQLSALLLASWCKERVVEASVAWVHIVQALCVADEVDFGCHCERSCVDEN